MYCGFTSVAVPVAFHDVCLPIEPFSEGSLLEHHRVVAEVHGAPEPVDLPLFGENGNDIGPRPELLARRVSMPSRLRAYSITAS
jgi:hypothetical protein